MMHNAKSCVQTRQYLPVTSHLLQWILVSNTLDEHGCPYDHLHILS